MFFFGFPVALNLETGVVVDPGDPVVRGVDLLSAMLSLASESSAAEQLASISTRKVPDGTALPYSTIEERSSRRELQSSTLTVYSVIVATRVYAADLDQAGTIGDLLHAGLLGQQPSFTGVLASPLLAQGEPRHGDAPGRARNASRIYYQDREYRVRIVRAV